VIELTFENVHSRQERICQVKFSKSSLTESLHSQFVGENDFWEFEPPIQRDPALPWWQMCPNPRALGARRARPFRRYLWCIAKAAPPARLKIVKYVCIYTYVYIRMYVRRAHPFRRDLWCIAKQRLLRASGSSNMCIYMYICASLCLDVCMYVCMYIMYMCIMYMYNIWIVIFEIARKQRIVHASKSLYFRYIYVCMLICLYVRTSYILLHIYMCLYTCMYVCMYKTYECMYVCMYKTYECMYVCMYKTYECMYVCMYKTYE